VSSPNNPPTSEKWCKEDDYEFRGVPLNTPPDQIPEHVHLDRYRVKFKDGSIIGMLPPDNEERG
jgi:hypothetical protein